MSVMTDEVPCLARSAGIFPIVGLDDGRYMVHEGCLLFPTVFISEDGSPVKGPERFLNVVPRRFI